MHKLWTNIVYVTMFAYCFINHTPVVHAAKEELENFDEDAMAIDYDTLTNNHAQNIWRTTFFRSHPNKLFLLWTNSLPAGYGFSSGRQSFYMCYHSKCLVTYGTDCDDPTEYDVIVFFAHDMYNISLLPKDRSPHQKYVFVSIEPSERYPMHSDTVNGFFNWTWTYKLNSDLMWIPFVVENNKKKIVAPKLKVNWIKPKDMGPVSKPLEKILKGKTIAAVWFTSECFDSNRDYVNTLKKILAKRYKLQLDTYGKCSELQCVSNNEEDCYKLIRRDYYFYLAFENSCSDDYVTDVLLPAVQYNAVPIVSGCANYSRFLPDGSYLNAKTKNPMELAAEMNLLIQNFDQYITYFNWTNHYKYVRTTANLKTDIFCRMCALLHSNKLKKVSAYKDFQKWWNLKSVTYVTSYEKEINIPNGEEEKPVKPVKKSWLRKILDYEFWKLIYSFY